MTTTAEAVELARQNGGLRVDDVLERVKISHTTLYRRVKEGTFPAPKKIGGAVVWSRAEVDEYIAEQARQARVALGGVARKAKAPSELERLRAENDRLKDRLAAVEAQRDALQLEAGATNGQR